MLASRSLAQEITILACSLFVVLEPAVAATVSNTRRPATAATSVAPRAQRAVINFVPSTKPSKLQVLNDALAHAKTPLEKFHAKSQLLTFYATSFLSDENIKSGRALAVETLKEAPLFQKDWDYGNVVHHAHILLGRIYLATKDTRHSMIELREASNVKGSPQLNTFGPNLLLARDLLDRGAKSEVLRYLDMCAKFWSTKDAKRRLTQWKAQIKNGRHPTFGKNLDY